MLWKCEHWLCECESDSLRYTDSIDDGDQFQKGLCESVVHSSVCEIEYLLEFREHLQKLVLCFAGYFAIIF